MLGLGAATVFSTINLPSSYHQMLLHPDIQTALPGVQAFLDDVMEGPMEGLACLE